VKRRLIILAAAIAVVGATAPDVFPAYTFFEPLNDPPLYPGGDEFTRWELIYRIYGHNTASSPLPALPPAQQAARNGETLTLRSLLEEDPALAKDEAVLTVAVGAGRLEVVRLLLSKGADVNVRSSPTDPPPLGDALLGGRIDVATLLASVGGTLGDPALDAAAFGRLEELERMLESTPQKANVVAPDGRTPLWWAVRMDHFDVVRLLLWENARHDVTVADESILHVARSLRVAEVLVDAGLTVERAERIRPGLVHLAIRLRAPELADFYVGNGADVTAPDADGMTSLVKAAGLLWPPGPREEHLVLSLIERGAPVDGRNAAGATALHLAVFYAADPKVLNALLDAGAPVDARDNEALTPLHVAAMNERTEAARLLLAAGATANAADEKGRTPLHYAARMWFPGTCEVLVSAGAHPRSRDADGRTPFDLAKEEVVYWRAPKDRAVAAILERAVGMEALAEAEGWFRAAATCALTCAGLLALGFAVIAVKMIGQRHRQAADRRL
jgi:serine/threonine-protein phosphatase 6 regulatory ankyrin repeat subunit A